MQCRICGSNKIKQVLNVYDLNYGGIEKFIYFQCAECECLQIKEIPKDMSIYYGNNYYSLNTRGGKSFASKIINSFIRVRDKRLLSAKDDCIKKLCCRFQPRLAYELISRYCNNKSMKILDIGGGNGYLCEIMQEVGYNDLTCIDPYLTEKQYGGITFIKGDIFSLKNKYDFIMCHHSYEHMDKPKEVMNKISNLLNENGICMICIPVSNSYAFKRYRDKWVQLDAPRHLYIHSTKSIQFLAEQAGMKLKKTVYDSNSFQFLGSMLYEKGVYGHERRKLKYVLWYALMSFIKYSHKAEILNREGKGDQAIFILRK